MVLPFWVMLFSLLVLLCGACPSFGGAVFLLLRVVLRSSLFLWAVLLWVVPRSNLSLVWWFSSLVVLVYPLSQWRCSSLPPPPPPLGGVVFLFLFWVELFSPPLPGVRC